MKRAGLVAIALVAVAAALRLYAFVHEDVQIFSDLIEFTKTAAQSLTSAGFWAGTRPPAVPLIHKLIGDDPTVIAWVQVIVGVCAWSALALAVFATTRSVVMSGVGLIAVLVLGSSSVVAEWDKVIVAAGWGRWLLALCF